MGYYYLAWFALSYAMRQPWLLVGLLALYFVRGLVPPPGALFGAFGKLGRLREQVRVNRGNITARRDLATLYITLLRPKQALSPLEEALALSPDDAELLYLYGLALHRAGRHDEALARLLVAIEKDARLRHGQPYLVAGDTLLALRRWDDAADAFERFLDFNSADVVGHTQLARAYAGAGDAAAARKWLLAGIAGWHTLPGALKRRQLGAYFKAQWARITVLKDAGAMLVALALLAALVFGVGAALPLVASLWRPRTNQALMQRTFAAMKLCGSQQTGEFAGRYEATLDAQAAMPGMARSSAGTRRHWQAAMAEQLSNFHIDRDRIVSGRQVVQEFCLTKVIERKAGELHAEAITRYHESRKAGGAAGARDQTDDDESLDEGVGYGQLLDVHLNRGEDMTRFSFAPIDQPLQQTSITLRRRD